MAVEINKKIPIKVQLKFLENEITGEDLLQRYGPRRQDPVGSFGRDLIGAIRAKILGEQKALAESFSCNAEKRVRPGFYTVRGLSGYLTPHLWKGLEQYLEKEDLQRVGSGGYGSIYWTRWPGRPEGAIVKYNRRNSVAKHEASFLAYLNGAGGAPRLLYCEPSKGIIVMEYLGSRDMSKLARSGLGKKTWMLVFISLTYQLSDIHRLDVVHSDLKPNNVMVSFDEEGLPTAHLIDFGISTLSGQRAGLVWKSDNWRKELKKRPWYAAEFYKGEILDTRADIVGLAYSMKVMMPFMKYSCQRLYQLRERAMSHNKEERPSLKEIYTALRKEYASLGDSLL